MCLLVVWISTKDAFCVGGVFGVYQRLCLCCCAGVSAGYEKYKVPSRNSGIEFHLGLSLLCDLSLFVCRVDQNQKKNHLSVHILISIHQDFHLDPKKVILPNPNPNPGAQLTVENV